MFVRVKKVGPYQYLQIAENRREGKRVKQSIIATLGRLDKLTASGAVDQLLRSAARFGWPMSAQERGVRPIEPRERLDRGAAESKQRRSAIIDEERRRRRARWAMWLGDRLLERGEPGGPRAERDVDAPVKLAVLLAGEGPPEGGRRHPRRAQRHGRTRCAPTTDHAAALSEALAVRGRIEDAERHLADARSTRWRKPSSRSPWARSPGTRGSCAAALSARSWKQARAVTRHRSAKSFAPAPSPSSREHLSARACAPLLPLRRSCALRLIGLCTGCALTRASGALPRRPRR